MDKRETTTDSFQVQDAKNEGSSRIVLIDSKDVARFLGITSKFELKDLIFMMGGDYEAVPPLEPKGQTGEDYKLFLRKKK